MRPRWIVPVMVVAAVGLILSIAGLVTVLLRGQAYRSERVQEPAMSGLQPDPETAGLSVPEFSMTDQSGEKRTQAILDGQVTVLDFIFTNCPFACPIMTGAMSDVADRLKGTKVKFLSVSVDPAHDTPARLTEFARQHEADLSRWTFLTGDDETVHRIVRGSLQFLLQPDTTRTIQTADGGSMNNITHPTKLLLIGPDRQVLGMYEPQSDDDLNRLEARARSAAARLR
jgi:protein SCO1/2